MSSCARMEGSSAALGGVTSGREARALVAPIVAEVACTVCQCMRALCSCSHAMVDRSSRQTSEASPSRRPCPPSSRILPAQVACSRGHCHSRCVSSEECAAAWLHHSMAAPATCISRLSEQRDTSGAHVRQLPPGWAAAVLRHTCAVCPAHGRWPHYPRSEATGLGMTAAVSGSVVCGMCPDEVLNRP